MVAYSFARFGGWATERCKMARSGPGGNAEATPILETATPKVQLSLYSHVVPGMQKQLAEQLGAMVLGGSVEVR